MDSSTKQLNQPEPEVEQSPLAPSPLPTPQGAATPEDSPQPATNSFHPTAVTFPDQDVAEAHYIRPGTIIEGYILLKMIASTKMSVVFQARQPGTGQLVALKLIQRGAFSDRESSERFQQEIRTLGQMQPHKNIVPIYHVGRYGNEHYYVMPYLAGGSLSHQMERFQNDRRKSVALIEKIARAVHQLHTHKPKVLHRDIKPGNILLAADDEPLLADFGLIKLLDADHALTRTDQRPGTPSYMAPEQTGLVAAPVNERTDIWALGVVLYELLTGKRPFAIDEGEDTAKLLWKIVHKEPVRPRNLRPDIDAGLEAVILKCLEKDPADRYGSAAELADELERWRRGEAPHVRPESKLRRWWRASKRTRAVTAAVMSIAFFVAAAAVYWRAADPQRGLVELQRQYAASERVVLVDDKRAITWHEWLLKNPGALTRSTDGYHQLSSENLAVLALAKDLPVDTFRFRAKIRHDVSNTLDAEIGLFVACRPIGDEKEPAYLMYKCTFNDIREAKELERQGLLPPNTIRGNNFQMKYKVSMQVGPELETWEPMWVKLAHFEPAGHLGGRWREVAIEVHADRLVAFLGEKRTDPLILQKAEKRLTTEIPEFFTKHQMPAPAVAKTFDPHGCMGIFVMSGIASFKDVVVEKLPSQ